ncbi:MAG: cyclodeaminase/cyclohydrolase family protein [Gammaproteobacteria bacterium]|nr:cyclodeaminase/cyclohydrolase family protein [Gammaproteobacteria bacterium]
MQKNDFWSMTLSELLTKTKSANSVPGGGAIAAMVANFGLALIIMALKVTMQKSGSESSDLANYLSKLEKLSEKLKLLPEKDMHSFDAFMQIYRINKSATDSKNLIEAATALVNDTILIATEICAVVDLLDEFYQKIHNSIIADVASGLYLLEAALKSTMLNYAENCKIAEKKCGIIFETKEALVKPTSAKFGEIHTYIQNILN